MTVRLPTTVDTTPATWLRRTLRYLSIYLVLALSLVAVRSKTQHIRPNLLDMQKQEADLTNQRDDLEIAVQVALTPQKIQDWAAKNGMIHFAESGKSARDLGQGAAPAAVSAPASAAATSLTNHDTTIEVKTQWK